MFFVIFSFVIKVFFVLWLLIFEVSVLVGIKNVLFSLWSLFFNVGVLLLLRMFKLGFIVLSNMVVYVGFWLRIFCVFLVILSVYLLFCWIILVCRLKVYLKVKWVGIILGFVFRKLKGCSCICFLKIFVFLKILL